VVDRLGLLDLRVMPGIGNCVKPGVRQGRGELFAIGGRGDAVLLAL
jgi:hypothetical protein